MKIKKITIVFIMILCLGIFLNVCNSKVYGAEVVSNQQTYKAYTIKKVILREKRSNSSKKLEELDFCKKIIVISKEKNGWLKVKAASGNIGYLKETKISKQKPYKAYTIKKVILREKRSNSSKKLEELDFCKNITVISKEKNGWLKVKAASGNIGYLKETKISKQKPYKVYTVKKVILREKRSNSSKNIEELDFCKNITVISKEKNGWLKVRAASGNIGYLKETKISKQKPYIDKKGYIKAIFSANLRSGASDKSGVITSLKAGEIVTIVSKQNNWYRVKTSKGKQGYVREDLVVTKNSQKLELLATYTTYSKGSPANRNFNIARACGKITGTTLKPGQTFNWFNVVGSCGGQNGYKKATVIVNGKYIQDYGGGVCQVATTLCGVAKKGLKIKNIYCKPHTGHVSYLNGDGVEAAVSYGSKNFIFKNTTKNTIKLEMYSEGGRVIAVAYKVK